uniref:ATP-grasp fold succinyl-CoA synthetase-type domain-containing protein n=1 Tax=Ditylenchus dipsaci TaxID=166011 RepID=A0A915DWY0_9BILA
MCRELWLCKRLYPRHEFHFSITTDRNSNARTCSDCSSKGGVDIVEVAAADPTAIITVPVEISIVVTRERTLKFAEKWDSRLAMEFCKFGFLKDLLSLKLDSMGRQVRLPGVNRADGTSQDLAVTVLGDKEAFGAGKFARNEITVEFHGQGAQKYFAFSGYKMDVSGCVDDNWVPTNVKKSR